MQRAQILSELADVGSIDALLTRHESLARADVVDALHGAASAEGLVQDVEPISPIYRAYNGFMLGLFTAGWLLFEQAGKNARRDAIIRRITDFLLELSTDTGHPVELNPGDSSIEDALDAEARARDAQLADYYQLGLAAFRYVIRRTERAGAKDLKEGHRLLRSLGHPPILFETALNVDWSTDADGAPTGQSIFTQCLHLARDLIDGLGTEDDTCFVAMPFRRTYEWRYLRFYREVAARMRKRSLRAWGGVANEDHQELLLTLVARTGLLIADVTVPNANVALEVGLALGQGKTPLLLADQARWKRAANIQLDWVYPYRASGKHWESEAAMRAGLYYTSLHALRRPGVVPSWSARPLDVLQLLAALPSTVDSINR
jgi:hypothetical protein